MKNNKKIKIFVDGNCIVCDWEISKYKLMAPDKFDIIDISAENFNASQFGLSPEKVNKHMHVMTTNNEIFIGVDAFATIWSSLPKFHFAAKAIKWPVVYQLAKVGYFGFAEIRPYLPKKK